MSFDQRTFEARAKQIVPEVIMQIFGVLNSEDQEEEDLISAIARALDQEEVGDQISTIARALASEGKYEVDPLDAEEPALFSCLRATHTVAMRLAAEFGLNCTAFNLGLYSIRLTKDEPEQKRFGPPPGFYHEAELGFPSKKPEPADDGSSGLPMLPRGFFRSEDLGF